MEDLGALTSSFSMSSLIAGILFSSIGIYIFRRGKAEANISWAVIGIALMVYSLFTSSPWVDWGVGIALCAVAYQKRQ